MKYSLTDCVSISNVTEHYRNLSEIDANQTLEIDASEVAEVDTAGMQLLASLCKSRQMETVFNDPTQEFINVARLLGLSNELGLNSSGLNSSGLNNSLTKDSLLNKNGTT